MASEADTAIHRYVRGEISADACLRIISSDTAETIEARASRARVMQICESAAKWLGQ
jgi:hypothetical protein